MIGLVSNGLIIWERSGSRPPRLINLSVQVSVPLAPDFCTVLPDNQILLVRTQETKQKRVKEDKKKEGSFIWEIGKDA